MRPFLILLGGLALLFNFSFAQQSEPQSLHRRSALDYLNRQVQPWQNPAPLLHSPQAPQKSQATSSLTTTYTGTSRNLSFGRFSDDPIVADEETGVVAIVHLQNGGLSPNQTNFFQVDLSTNSGLSFSSDLGPLGDSIRFNKRRPSLALANPTGSNQPGQSHLIYNGYAQTPGRSLLTGAFQINSNQPLNPASSQQYLWDSLNLQGPFGLTEGLPGEFWMITPEFSPTNSGFSGQLFVFKGVWNSSLNDLDWSSEDDSEDFKVDRYGNLAIP